MKIDNDVFHDVIDCLDYLNGNDKSYIPCVQKELDKMGEWEDDPNNFNGFESVLEDFFYEQGIEPDYSSKQKLYRKLRSLLVDVVATFNEDIAYEFDGVVEMVDNIYHDLLDMDGNI